MTDPDQDQLIKDLRTNAKERLDQKRLAEAELAVVHRQLAETREKLTEAARHIAWIEGQAMQGNVDRILEGASTTWPDIAGWLDSHKAEALDHLIKQACDAFDAMTPEEQEAHMRAQRESWVRGEMGMGSDADEAAYQGNMREPERFDPVQKMVESGPSLKPGIYRHYKGSTYGVLGEGLHSETGDPLVIYQDNGGSNWFRPKAMFTETVNRDGKDAPRFKYTGHDYGYQIVRVK